MSTTIENKVVEMQFDNRHFEKNVQTSLGTIDKLKQSLDLSGASKGLEDINSAAKNVDMSPLGGAVETVGLKFNALYTIADQALRNITNSVMNTGKRVISALTIDPVKTGLSEYETKIGAIQTIMSNTASKGTTMEDVTRVIGELNTYADKTIYNFAEMTRNIGTFTAAGVGLEESASAIQGIANLAAASGSNSQQASTAMYQLSQALASGTVKLMDWNSVVNAGMGGQKFQDALKATAKEHGVAIDDIIAKNGSFRESLQDGWLSADILNETLRKFTVEGAKEYADSMVASGKYTKEQADALIKEAQAMEDAATKVKTFTQLWDTLKESAQSGWSQSWEIIIGDFEEAKEFWTEVSETLGGIIGASADARNEMLENWKVLGGRVALIDSLRNAFEGVMSIVKPIGEAFREIFPPMTGERLLALTEGLRDLTAKLKLSETTSDNLKRTFKGLFAILSIIKQAFTAAFKAIKPLFGGVGELGGGILGVTAAIGDWLVKLNDHIKATNIFGNVLQGIVSIIMAVFKVIKKLAVAIKDRFVAPGLEIFRDILVRIYGLMTGVGDAAGHMKSGVVSAIDSVGSALSECSLVKVLEGLWKLIKTVAKGIIKVLDSLTGGIVETLGSGDITGFVAVLNGLVSGGIGIGLISLIQSIRGSVAGLGDILDGVGGCFEAFQTRLKADALLKIASAIALLTAALLVLSLIDKNKLNDAIGAITTLFIELMTATAVINKLNSGPGLRKATTAMLKLSAALLILSLALKIIGTIPVVRLCSSLVAIAVSMGVLVAAVRLLPDKDVTSAATAIKRLSTALLILAVALKIMSTMSWSELAVGLVGMTVGLAALVAAVNLLPENIALKTLGMTSLAIAMVILAAALKIMATMSWSELAVSLTALAGTMVILALGMTAMIASLPGAAAMLIVAPALILLASALKILGTMSWGDVARGLVALTGALVILALGMTAMIASLPGAAAMLVVAAALAIFVPVLLMLGTASWGTIGAGLLALAGIFVVVGVAGLLLQPLVPTILALSAALVLLGVACLAIGVGVLALGTGLSLVVTAGAAAVTTLVSLVASLINLIPTFIAKLGEGFILLLQIIVDSAPVIAEAIAAVIVGLCNAIIASMPAIVECIGVLLDALLGVLIEYVPKIVDVAVRLIVALLEGLASQIGDVIDAAVNLIVAFITGINSGIDDIIQAGVDLVVNLIAGIVGAIGQIISAAVDVCISFLDGIASQASKIIKAGADLILKLIDGMFKTINHVITVATDLCIAFIKGIANQVSKVVQAGVDLILDFINGMADSIRNNTPKIIAAVNNLMSAVFEAIGMFVGNAPQLGKQLIQGFIKGLKASGGNLVSAAVGVVKKAWGGITKFLGIKSPSKLATEAGMYVDEGMAIGLAKYAKVVSRAAIGVGKETMSSLNGAISGISDAFNRDIDSRPTIRPVLDLSDVESGASTIGSLLGQGTSVGVSANVSAINSMMSRRNQNGGIEDMVSAIDKLRKDFNNADRTTYQINGITYDSGSAVEDAVQTLVRAAKIERRT